MAELFGDLSNAPEPKALTRGLWARRFFMTLFALVPLVALTGALGQSASTSTATGPAASLRLEAPETVRGGLFFQSRVEIRAQHDVEHPRLVLDPGWFEGMQVNSIEPQPTGEQSRGDHIVLSYDKLAAGDIMVVWLQFEVDPTAHGTHDYDLELDDAEQPIAHLDRSLRILP
jgi:hypothetical protein